MSGGRQARDYEDLVDEVLIVEKGKFKGRICYCDGIELSKAFISFGRYLLVCDLHDIPARNLRRCTMGDLLERRSQLEEEIGRNNWMGIGKPLDEFELIDMMHELSLVENEIMAKHQIARYSATKQGKKLYLAHASADKGFVRRVYADLKVVGHDPWLDEYDINVGESIVDKIQSGIDQSDFLILFMSKNALNSDWVRVEWQTKFWTEIGSTSPKVLVALINDCELPQLLRAKKYADFTRSYSDAFEGILRAIGHEMNGIELQRKIRPGGQK